MITKFKIFESHEDVDPYGEEDWENDVSRIKILPNIKHYIENNNWGTNFFNFIGKIVNIRKKVIYKDIECYEVPDNLNSDLDLNELFGENSFRGNVVYLIPKDCAEIIE